MTVNRSIHSTARTWIDRIQAFGLAMAADSPEARRRVIEAFRAAGATTPATAQPFSARSQLNEYAVGGLLQLGIIREAARGRYYLDERALQRRRQESPWLDFAPWL
ncbi:MAG: hypothetical protein IH878_09390 [Gemmatimonadetes bacterium]|nr:hypothetical protein [Gemmatimonadota bacterium]